MKLSVSLLRSFEVNSASHSPWVVRSKLSVSLLRSFEVNSASHSPWVVRSKLSVSLPMGRSK
ncbi:hypothetical protein MAL08_04220 [Leptospira noguchii]|uniref:hypothetical protein n=1 Tax=Leptospira noguchii TaxID=28182 RepID=UPI001FB5904E|nr:hypothetical protein [Leptospira noguchii]UOG38532.1 hypothetical protein MAL08_04220 [Leptospira noguchii]